MILQNDSFFILQLVINNLKIGQNELDLIC